MISAQRIPETTSPIHDRIPRSRFASRLSTFYSLNVCGAIAGSLLTGFFLLPRYGSRTSIIVVCAATLASAIALLAVSPLGRIARVLGSAAMAAAFVLIARAVPSPVDSLLALRHPGEPIIWREEGVQTTASIHTIAGGRRRVMYLDGYHQADDTGGIIQVHHRIGVLPLAIHPNPRAALVVEYFELVKHALNDNGLMLQWIEGTDAEWRLVARTFLSVFPDATVWADGTLLVGTKRPLMLDSADFNLKREIPGFAEALDTIGLTRFDDLVALFRAGLSDLRRFVGDGPILTDDRPILECFLSQPRNPHDLSALHSDVAPYLAR